MHTFAPPLLSSVDNIVAISPCFRSVTLPTVLLSGIQGRLSRVAWRGSLRYAAEHDWDLPLTGVMRTPLVQLFPIWSLVRTAIKASSLYIPAQSVVTGYEESLDFACSSAPRLSAQQAATTLDISRSAFRHCVLTGYLRGITVPCRIDFSTLLVAVESLDVQP